MKIKNLCAKITEYDLISRIPMMLRNLLLCVISLQWLFLIVLFSIMIIIENNFEIFIKRNLFIITCLFIFSFIIIYISVRLFKFSWNKLRIIEMQLFNKTFKCEIIDEVNNEILDSKIFYTKLSLQNYLEEIEYIVNAKNNEILNNEQQEKEN